MKVVLYSIILVFISLHAHTEDGHNLWLRNKSKASVNVVSAKNSPTLAIAKKELEQGWQGEAGAKVALTLKKDKAIKGDGFRISKSEVQANTELGILYGVYELLRLQQTGQTVQEET